ncbi:hypothetical protein Q9233_004030 [Columba guinea]|nr:hypothetical protein Q9233_004030 [Columba guinea]
MDFALTNQSNFPSVQYELILVVGLSKQVETSQEKKQKEIPLFLPRPLHKEDPDFSLDYYLAHLQQLKEVSELHKRRAGKLMVNVVRPVSLPLTVETQLFPMPQESGYTVKFCILLSFRWIPRGRAEETSQATTMQRAVVPSILKRGLRHVLFPLPVVFRVNPS